MCFLFFYCYKGVRLYHCETATPNPPGDVSMNMAQWWNDTNRKIRGLGEKPVAVPLFPLEILHELPWTGSVMRSKWLTWYRFRIQ